MCKRDKPDEIKCFLKENSKNQNQANISALSDCFTCFDVSKHTFLPKWDKREYFGVLKSEQTINKERFADTVMFFLIVGAAHFKP